MSSSTKTLHYLLELVGLGICPWLPRECLDGLAGDLEATLLRHLEEQLLKLRSQVRVLRPLASDASHPARRVAPRP